MTANSKKHPPSPLRAAAYTEPREDGDAFELPETDDKNPLLQVSVQEHIPHKCVTAEGGTFNHTRVIVRSTARGMITCGLRVDGFNKLYSGGENHMDAVVRQIEEDIAHLQAVRATLMEAKERLDRAHGLE